MDGSAKLEYFSHMLADTMDICNVFGCVICISDPLAINAELRTAIIKNNLY